MKNFGQKLSKRAAYLFPRKVPRMNGHAIIKETGNSCEHGNRVFHLAQGYRNGMIQWNGMKRFHSSFPRERSNLHFKPT